MTAAPSTASGPGGGSSSSGHHPDKADMTFNAFHFSSFAALEVAVTITPRFSMARVDGLGGSYGPFAPHFPVEVPLWLALCLVRTDTCAVHLPAYLHLSFLQSVLEKERANERHFERLPFYFYEIVKLFADWSATTERHYHLSAFQQQQQQMGGGERGAATTVADPSDITEVIRLVTEIKAIRQKKIFQSMAIFEAENAAMTIPGIKLTNLVSVELQYLRESFAVVLGQAARLDAARRAPLPLPPVRAVGSTVLTSPSPQSPPQQQQQQQPQRQRFFSTPGSVTEDGVTTTTATSVTGSSAAAAAGRRGRPSWEGADMLEDGTMTTTTGSQPSTQQTTTLTSTTTTTTTTIDPLLQQQQQMDGEGTGAPPAPPAAVAPPLKKRRTLRQT